MTKPTDITIPSLDTWAKAAAKSAPEGDLAKLDWTTPEGITTLALFTAAIASSGDTRYDRIFSGSSRTTMVR